MNTEKEHKRVPAGFRASLFQVFLSLLWGGNHVSIKASLAYGSPLQVGWLRFFLGGLLTVPYVFSRGETLMLLRREIRPVLVIGLLFTIQILFMNFGQNITSAGHATALNATFPIWAAVFAHLLVPTDRLTRWKSLAIIFSYSGVLAIVFGDSKSVDVNISIWGDLMSLISAALLGFRVVLISNFAQDMSEAKLMFWQAVIGIVCFAPASFMLESPEFTANVKFWFALSYQGFVIAGFGFLANAWLMKRYLPSTITFFSFIQPPAGVILAWVFLSESPGQGLILGLILIGIGTIVFGGEAYLKTRRGVVGIK